jgi:hypothetical protein
LCQLGNRWTQSVQQLPTDRVAVASPTELTETSFSRSSPPSRHNLFLQRNSSLSAIACNWFIMRVRAWRAVPMPQQLGEIAILQFAT